MSTISKAAPRDMGRSLFRHLSLLSGFFGAGLLIYWISGGFPATTWLALYRAIIGFEAAWQGNEGRTLLSLSFLILQSCSLALAWVVLLWGIYQEITSFYIEIIRGRSLFVSTAHNGMPAEPQPAPEVLPLTETPTLLLLPEPVAPVPAPAVQDLENELPAWPELELPDELSNLGTIRRPAEKPQEEEKPPEPKIVRRLVAKKLENEFQVANPFEGTGKLPDVFHEEDLLKKDAATMDSEMDAGGFKLGNPFEGPGALPDVMHEEERLANPLEEAEIEETVIAHDGVTTVMRKSVDALDEADFVKTFNIPSPKAKEDIVAGVIKNPFDEDHDSTQEPQEGPYPHNPFDEGEDSSPGEAVVLDNPFDDGLKGGRKNDHLENPFDGEQLKPLVQPGPVFVREEGTSTLSHNPFEETSLQRLEALSASKKSSVRVGNREPVSPVERAKVGRRSEANSEMMTENTPQISSPARTQRTKPVPTEIVSSQGKTHVRGASSTTAFSPLNKQFLVSSITHTGLKRIGKPNEDTHTVLTEMRQVAPGCVVPVTLLLVADGMGGHTGGQYASSFVVDAVRTSLEEAVRDPQVEGEALKVHMVNAVRDANTQLFRSNDEAHNFRGTTLTGAFLIGEQQTKETIKKSMSVTAHIVNVGDSRAYIYSSARGLTRVTRDHSTVEQLIEQQVIAPEQRYTDSRRHQIYRCLGEKSFVEVDTFTITLESGDRLLLCTDGIWEMVRDDELEKLLSSSSDEPSQITALLLQAALEGGGEDNLTGIVLFVP